MNVDGDLVQIQAHLRNEGQTQILEIGMRNWRTFQRVAKVHDMRYLNHDLRRQKPSVTLESSVTLS